MEINLDKEAIERAVTSAIVQSAIGDKIKVAVNKLLSDYNSPIELACRDVVRQITIQTLNTEFGDKIREAVKAKMTDELASKMVMKLWDRLTD